MKKFARKLQNTTKIIYSYSEKEQLYYDSRKY